MNDSLMALATGTIGVSAVEGVEQIPVELLNPTADDLPLIQYLKLLVQLSIGIATIIRLLKERRARRLERKKKERQTDSEQ